MDTIKYTLPSSGNYVAPRVVGSAEPFATFAGILNGDAVTDGFRVTAADIDVSDVVIGILHTHVSGNDYEYKFIVNGEVKSTNSTTYSDTADGRTYRIEYQTTDNLLLADLSGRSRQITVGMGYANYTGEPLVNYVGAYDVTIPLHYAEVYTDDQAEFSDSLLPLVTQNTARTFWRNPIDDNTKVTLSSTAGDNLITKMSLGFNQVDGSVPADSVAGITWTATGSAAIASNKLSVSSGGYIQSGQPGFQIRTNAFKFAFKFNGTISTSHCIVSVTNTGISSGDPIEFSIEITGTYLKFYHGVRGTWQSALLMFATFASGTDYTVEFGRHVNGDWYCTVNGVNTTQYQWAPPAASISFGSVTTGTFNSLTDIGWRTDPLPMTIGQFYNGYFPFTGTIDFITFAVGTS